MRLRACLGCLCLTLAGCRHLPEGLKLDLANGLVAVGPCVCKALPAGVPAPPAPPSQGGGKSDEQPR